MLTTFKRRKCTEQARLAKSTFLAMLDDVPRTFVNLPDNLGNVADISNTNQVRRFYEDLPDDQWEIISFNPLTREVCVNHKTPQGERSTFVVLPVLSYSGPSTLAAGF